MTSGQPVAWLLPSAPRRLPSLLYGGLTGGGWPGQLLMVPTQHCEDGGSQGDLSACGSLWGHWPLSWVRESMA